ncbi:MAG: twin-arginine translocation pathway signal [Novosphingobium sp. SCN 66-18]|nr:MAG: twin-arginine translocation pathway signal [Novosphingobium sp. SCN 66-18]
MVTHETNGITRRAALGGLGATAAAFTIPARAAPASAADANALLDGIAWRLLDFFPETATSLGIDTGAHAALRAKLGDKSAAAQRAIAALLRADLARIAATDASGLDHSTRTSLAVVKSAYRTALDGFALPYGDITVGNYRNTPYVVIQNVGAYLDVPKFLDSDHPVADTADAEAYLARLAAYPGTLDAETERLRDTAAQRVIAPDFLLDKALAQLEASLADARQGGGLVDSIDRRTKAKGIAGDWAGRARSIATGQVVPALERQIAELRRQRVSATSDAGMSTRPDGEAWYAWALRASTTTRMTPDEIHQLGQEELKALQARMDPILRGLGYTKGTVGERMTALGKDPRFQFPDNDEGRAQIVAFIQKRLDFIRGKLPLAFRKLARGNVEVRRLPLAEEPGAPGAYGGPGSIDGSVPGRMWINLHTTRLHSKYSLPTLVHHEALPGHVWQGEYAQQLPVIRAILAFNAYTEGWALYAETLGDELGAYDGDPVGQLGYLQSIAFRACRLVVDTGLHSRRWSREQAIRWFAETNGSGIDEVTSEVDRYCSWPGQACGYKIGHSEILRQRARAKAALGARFDLRDFDDAVVGGGNVPLDVLGLNIDEYIRTAGK